MHMILELGCNHQGKMSIAKQLIDKATELKVWGIKLQKRDIENIPENIKNIKRDIKNSFGTTYYEHRKALEFNINQIKELKEYTEKKGLKFICSAFDINSAKQLKEIECEYIKVPSQLYLNNELFRFLTNNKIKTFVSTGMHNLYEITQSKWLQEAFCVMHCISEYPIISSFQLGAIHSLRHIVTQNIGYSSHSKTGKDIKLAYMAGAQYIERHFTLDKNMKGSDHETVSSTSEDIIKILKEIDEIKSEFTQRYIGEEEEKNKRIYRC